MGTCTQLQIVLVGSGEQTIAAYKTFAAIWNQQLKKETIRIIIISDEENYECNQLFGELIAGRLEIPTVSMPLAELAPLATILYGDITSIDKKTKQLQVRLKNGATQELWYDHLVFENIIANDVKSEQAAYVHHLNNAEHVRLLCRQIDLLVKQAAIARNALVAKNLLRFVLLIKSAKDIALANFIDHYIAARCSRYYALQGIKPECILVDECPGSQTTASTKILAQRMMSRSRVTWIRHQKIQRFTSEAVVLADGSFLAASMTIRCYRLGSMEFNHTFGSDEHGEIIADKFLRVKGENFIWCGRGISSQVGHEVINLQRFGKQIAHNIILAMECRLLKPYRRSILSYDSILFPNEALSLLYGAPVKGRIARHIHLLWLLFRLPSPKMRSEGFVNLISHFLWKKTKIETGLIHYSFASPSNMRAAS